MQRAILLTEIEGDTHVGIVGYWDTCPIFLVSDDTIGSIVTRRYLSDPSHSQEDKARYWLSMILMGLSDLMIEGNPFEPGDILHLAAMEWNGIQLPDTRWEVEDDFIEPIPLRD